MCTRVLWNDNGQAVLVGRNTDWPAETATTLWALPRGGRRGGTSGGDDLTWSVRHGSVVATTGDQGTTDGMNERGLAAHLLGLAESGRAPRDASLPAVPVSLWPQLFLDRFATVEECVALMADAPFQLRPAGGGEGLIVATAHLALDDASGDSALVEYLEGRPSVHHDRGCSVMTSSPPFDAQIEHLGRYQGFGGREPLPGGTDAAGRFVRASLYRSRLPRVRSRREAVAALFAALRSAGEAAGFAEAARPYLSWTVWRTVCDLTNRVYYFESSFGPSLVWARVGGLRLAEGTPPARVELPGRDPTGDLTDRFVPAGRFEAAPA